MISSEASVISMHFAATPVEFDQGDGISAGFQCSSISVSVSVSACGQIISARRTDELNAGAHPASGERVW